MLFICPAIYNLYILDVRTWTVQSNGAEKHGSAEKFNSVHVLFICSAMYNIYWTWTVQCNGAEKHLCHLKINLGVKIKVKNQPWRQNKGNHAMEK